METEPPSGDQGARGPVRRRRTTDRRDLLRIGTGLVLGAALSRAFAACAHEQDGARPGPSSGGARPDR